jgi:transformation/transcription domain-associated protein
MARGVGPDCQLCVGIIRLYEYLAINEKFVEPAFKLIQQTERALCLEVGSPFRPALIKLMIRFPVHTVNLFLCDNFLKDDACCRWLFYLLR